MKTFILALALALASVTSFAETKIEASTGEMQVLDLVVGIQQTYSQTSELQAKVVELLAGDGMNPTRMVLILNTGYNDSKIFELQEMMYSVKRITFLAKDVIVINYVQDNFDNMEEMNPIQVNKSITIQVLRNADGTLANEIKIIK